MQQATRLSISGMSCAGCVATVEKALAAVPGVDRADVNFVEHTANVVGEVDVQMLIDAVKSAGYGAASMTSEHAAEDKEAAETAHFRALLRKTIVAAVLGVPLFSLGMTGQLIWSSQNRPAEVDKYTHIIIHFEKGERVLFRDVRQFGEVYLAEKMNVENILKMGAEPLKKAFTPEILGTIISSTVKIKNLLMDQRRIAGIGNIYSDEILFEAGIHPLKKACSLRRTELIKLHKAIGLVLHEAIACKGDTFSDYRTLSGGQGTYQHFHRVYQREGESCRRCSESIVRVKLSGRSCHYCPGCQK